MDSNQRRHSQRVYSPSLLTTQAPLLDPLSSRPGGVPKKDERAPKYHPKQHESQHHASRLETRDDENVANNLYITILEAGMVKRNPRKPKDRDNSRAGVKKSSLPSSDPSWLYGFHTVLAALRNPHRQIKRVVTTKKGGDRLRNSLKENGNFEIVDSKAIEDLLPPGSVHQGIALLAAPLEPPTIETLI